MYIQHVAQFINSDEAVVKQMTLFFKQGNHQISKQFLKVIVIGYLFLTSSMGYAQEVPDINPIGAGYEVSSLYGIRFHPILQKSKLHTGIDFKTPIGTPIFATANGIVKKAVTSISGYGSHIIISHNSGYETLYAHLSKIKVNYSEYVRKGQLIGYSGNSGRSVNAHLHYEVRLSGQAIDPVDYLIFAK